MPRYSGVIRSFSKATSFSPAESKEGIPQGVLVSDTYNFACKNATQFLLPRCSCGLRVCMVLGLVLRWLNRLLAAC